MFKTLYGHLLNLSVNSEPGFGKDRVKTDIIKVHSHAATNLVTRFWLDDPKFTQTAKAQGLVSPGRLRVYSNETS